MLGLLIEPSPLKGEGLQGYLARLAAKNVLSGQELRRHYLKSPPEPAELSALVPYWGGTHAQLTKPSPAPMALWNTRTRRYCVCCLQEVPYWRAVWELSLVTECPTHNVALIQACPGCGKDLTWACSELARCGSCGVSLLEADAAPADPLRLWLSEQLGRQLIESEAQHLEGPESLSVDRLHQLAVCLGARLSEAGQRKPLKIKESCKLEPARRVAHSATELLKDWPQGLRCHLRTQLAADSAGSWQLSRRLGPIYRDIYKRLDDGCFGFVRSELEQVISQAWKGPINRRNRNLSHASWEGHAWVPIGAAARRLGLDQSLVRRMVNAGEVLAERQTLPSGKATTLVYLEDLRRRDSDLRSGLSLDQLAARWALPESRVRQLASAGVVPFFGGAPSAGERWWFAPSSVEEWVWIGDHLPVYEAPLERQETLSASLRYRLQSEDLARETLLQIRAGGLRPRARLGRPEAIGQWLFEIDDLVRLRGQIEGRDLLTVQECARELQIKDQVAYQLVRLGLLPTEEVHTRQGKVSRVRPSALKAFREVYVFGRDLVSGTQCASKWLAVRLIKDGHVPEAGPGVAGAECRQYLWRRTGELEKLMIGGCA